MEQVDWPEKKVPIWGKWVWPDKGWFIVHWETANFWKFFLLHPALLEFFARV